MNVEHHVEPDMKQGTVDSYLMFLNVEIYAYVVIFNLVAMYVCMYILEKRANEVRTSIGSESLESQHSGGDKNDVPSKPKKRRKRSKQKRKTQYNEKIPRTRKLK